jgi:hypothetical protein
VRLRPISPRQLSHEQRPLYQEMRAGIEGSFRGFTAIDESGALLGPWNPWLHYRQTEMLALVTAVYLSRTQSTKSGGSASCPAGQAALR